MKNKNPALVVLASLYLAFGSLRALDCGPSNNSSNSWDSCCFYGSGTESEPEEHFFVTSGDRSITYHEPCTPENDISVTEYWGPENNYVMVGPWDTVCGVDNYSTSVSYFSNSGPGNCEQCGFDERVSHGYQSCGG